VDDADGDGVVIVDLARGGVAAEAGMRRGDVIVSINRKRIANTADYQRIINQARGRSLVVLVRRGDSSIYFAIRAK